MNMSGSTISISARLALLLNLILCSGCILVPMIDSVERSGVNSSGRQALLHETITEFHHALFWGQANEALEYVSPQHADTMRTELRSKRDKERVVESDVELVDFSPDSFNASVEVTERFHDFSTNSVSSRLEIEKWEYSMLDGWKLVSRDRAES